MPFGIRLLEWVSSSPTFAKYAPRFVPTMDLAVHRLTRGKLQLSAQMVPGLVLTTRGAKSGLPRQSPLACMPEGLDTWVVLGSNYGLEKHPAWTSNLLAHPTEAEISWRGRSIPVTGRLLEGQERQAVWERAVRFWPPYATYQTRCRREIRVFLLTRR